MDYVTGDPIASWHAIVEPDNSYDCLASYDLFHMMGSTQVMDRESKKVMALSEVALIDVEQLGQIKDITTQIQIISGVERTETMVEVS